jgi:hypothetical protein
MKVLEDEGTEYGVSIEDSYWYIGLGYGTFSIENLATLGIYGPYLGYLWVPRWELCVLWARIIVTLLDTF